MAGTDGSLAAETLPSENVSLECPGITDLGRQAYGEQRVQENITKYVDQQFKKGEGQTERDENRRRRLQQARDISNNYYTLVTDFYEYGYGKSFHFAPVMDGTTMLECIRIYERETATALKAEPGMKLLDAGCGVGGPMREIARYSGAQVVGINPCEYQLKRAAYHTKQDKLEDLCSYVKGDFHDMEFEDNSFDGGFSFEATCYARDPVHLYKEILRVLKPGAIFVDSAWAMTDKYDPQNPDHVRTKDDIEIGNGVADMRTEAVILDAARRAGFEVTAFINAHHGGDLPWYTFLVGKSSCSLEAFRVSRVGRMATHAILSGLEIVHLVPQGSTAVHSLLMTAADGLTEGGKRDIFTPMFRLVLRKPL